MLSVRLSGICEYSSDVVAGRVGEVFVGLWMVNACPGVLCLRGPGNVGDMVFADHKDMVFAKLEVEVSAGGTEEAEVLSDYAHVTVF